MPRLTGIRELYHMLTGDFDLHGGFYRDRVQLATTADFTGLVKNAMNKIIVKRWAQLGRAGYDWWKNIATVEHFNSLKASPARWWAPWAACRPSPRAAITPN